MEAGVNEVALRVRRRSPTGLFANFHRFLFFFREDSKLARVIFFTPLSIKTKNKQWLFQTSSPLGENVSENLIRYPIKFLPRKIPQMPEKVAPPKDTPKQNRSNSTDTADSRSSLCAERCRVRTTANLVSTKLEPPFFSRRHSSVPEKNMQFTRKRIHERGQRGRTNSETIETQLIGCSKFAETKERDG